MIYQVMNIYTLESMYFKKLSDLISYFGFVDSTVRNKLSKAQSESQNFVIVNNYRISKIEVK